VVSHLLCTVVGHIYIIDSVFKYTKLYSRYSPIEILKNAPVIVAVTMAVICTESNINAAGFE
jgi:hypothetical protein